MHSNYEKVSFELNRYYMFTYRSLRHYILFNLGLDVIKPHFYTRYLGLNHFFLLLLN
jgi:hypothetical protein